MPIVTGGYQILLGSYNITPDITRISYVVRTDVLDSTTIDQTSSRTFVAGLPYAEIEVDGYWDEDVEKISAALHSYNGVDNVPLQIFTKLSGAGEGVGAGVSAIEVSRTEEIGKLARIKFTCKTYTPPMRLFPLYSLTTRSGAGSNNGNNYQLGSVPSGKKLYGMLCVTAASGTSPQLTVKFQSSSTYDGIYYDRLTFTTTSGPTYEIKTVNGPITDTWWRQYWTISGTSPSFTFASGWGVM